MPFTETNQFNMALSCLGTRSRVLSTTDGTKEQKALSVVYETLRDELLAQYTWSFAKLRVALVAQAVATAPDNWSYVYQRPADCLKVRFISAPGVPPDVFAGLPPIPYETTTVLDDTTPTPLKKKAILTDQPDAVLCYTWQVTDPDYFPPHFRSVFAWKLAAGVALNLTNPAVADACAKTFSRQFELAAAIDAQEGLSRSRDQTAPWDSARGQGPNRTNERV